MKALNCEKVFFNKKKKRKKSLQAKQSLQLSLNMWNVLYICMVTHLCDNIQSTAINLRRCSTHPEMQDSLQTGARHSGGKKQ